MASNGRPASLGLHLGPAGLSSIQDVPGSQSLISPEQTVALRLLRQEGGQALAIEDKQGALLHSLPLNSAEVSTEARFCGAWQCMRGACTAMCAYAARRCCPLPPAGVLLAPFAKLTCAPRKLLLFALRRCGGPAAAC